MKDKINRILTKHIHAQCHAEINLHTVQGIIPATQELTALMCYREVRAALEGTGDVSYFISHNSFIYWLKELLEPDYDEGIILQAIEQVKNEQK